MWAAVRRHDHRRGPKPFTLQTRPVLRSKRTVTVRDDQERCVTGADRRERLDEQTSIPEGECRNSDLHADGSGLRPLRRQ